MYLEGGYGFNQKERNKGYKKELKLSRRLKEQGLHRERKSGWEGRS